MSYANGTPQHIAIYVHAIASFLSIVFTMLFIWKGRPLLFFHGNFKILVYVLLGGFLVHGISLYALQMVHSIVLWTAKDPCDLNLSNLFCFLARFPSAAATNLFVYCQMAMIIERIFATKHLGKYEKTNTNLGMLLALIVISLSIVMTLLMFHKWDVTKTSTYCGTSNSYTRQEVFYVTSVFNSAIAFCTFVGFLVVMYYNKKLRGSNVADIYRRYQCAENVIVLKMLAPQIVSLSLFLVVYGTLNGVTYFTQPAWASSQIFSSTLTFVNLVPYYTVFSPMLMLWLLKKHQASRKMILEGIANDRTDARNAYFENYRAMWNTN